MKRLFIAIHIPCGVRLLEILTDLRNRLEHERISWSKPDNLHLTLKFLGETPPEAIVAIVQQVEKAIAETPPFRLSLDRVGIFGSRYDPRVIWIGNQLSEQPVVNLANLVLDACAVAGFARDRQNFVPHLTLGRIKGLTNKAYFQEVIKGIAPQAIQEVEVNRLILFESILRKEGPLYIPLHEFKLKG